MIHPYRLIAFLIALLFAAPPPCRADDATQQRLLAEVRDANRTAIRGVRTLQTGFEVKRERTAAGDTPDSDAPFGPGLFHRTDDCYRLLWSRSDGLSTDAVVRFGREWRLSRGGPLRKPDFQVGPAPREHATWAWDYLLFSHPGPSPANQATGDLFPLFGLLDEPHTLHAAERLPPAGGRAGEIRLELAHRDGRLEVWASPAHGGLVRKRVWRPKGVNRHHEGEVVEFAEPEPGVFLPVAVEHRTFVRDELTDARRLVLKDVRVNRPLPREAFRIPGVADLAFDSPDFSRPTVGLAVPPLVTYQVDADGYRVDAERGRDGVIGDAALRQPGLAVGGPIDRPQAPEPPPLAPWWVWGLVASLGVVVVAAGMEIHRLRKLVPQTPTPSQ